MTQDFQKSITWKASSLRFVDRNFYPRDESHYDAYKIAVVAYFSCTRNSSVSAVLFLVYRKLLKKIRHSPEEQLTYF